MVQPPLRRRGRRVRVVVSILSATVLLWLAWSPIGTAHVFVAKFHRAGAIPATDGRGWVGEAFLNLPNFDPPHFARLQQCLDGPERFTGIGCRAGDLDRDGDVDLRDVWRFARDYRRASLVKVERFIINREPDFTFRTDWIDFPAGPEGSRLDADFGTLGDFLGDQIRNVSELTRLDEPFGTMILRFRGLIRVTLPDEVRIRPFIELPVWIDIATMGFDGYRLDIGETVYLVSNVNFSSPRQPFFRFGPAIQVPGLFPIQVTYFNSYDPQAAQGSERAGIEVYGFYEGGLPWPAGEQMQHEFFGVGTVVPPAVIYQNDDALPVLPGDFDADFDIDLRDVRWFAICANPDLVRLPSGCDAFDLNGDRRVTLVDFASFQATLKGPQVPLLGP